MEAWSDRSLPRAEFHPPPLGGGLSGQASHTPAWSTGSPCIRPPFRSGPDSSSVTWAAELGRPLNSPGSPGPSAGRPGTGPSERGNWEEESLLATSALSSEEGSVLSPLPLTARPRPPPPTSSPQWSERSWSATRSQPVRWPPRRRPRLPQNADLDKTPFYGDLLKRGEIPVKDLQLSKHTSTLLPPSLNPLSQRLLVHPTSCPCQPSPFPDLLVLVLPKRSPGRVMACPRSHS